MKKKIIIANWKMNPGSLKEAVSLTKQVEGGIQKNTNARVIIAPPFPLLLPVRKALRKSKLGAQDMFWEPRGAYTGEVSGEQLKRCGVSYVIIGHSERRIHFKETDAVINKKIKAALKSKLTPVLAIGETKRMPLKKIQRVLSRQLSRGLDDVSRRAFKNGIIAYEPVWAIGTGLAATPRDAKKTLAIIKEALQRLWKTKRVATPILYGGSVKAKNAASFVSEKGGGMDGMLVGGASLNAKEFVGIIHSAVKTK